MRGGKRKGAGRKKGIQNRVSEEARREAAASGELPLAYMLRIMRNEKEPEARRDAMAIAAARFCHGTKKEVEISGKDGGPFLTISGTMSPAEAAEAYASTLKSSE